MADRPAHILEIPDSLGRDVDAYRAGKLKDAPPVEAFMSDAALEQAAAQTAAASAPVHAEDLVPISKAEAARRTTFDGEHLPKMPAPRIVIPEPFRRPAVNLVSVEGPTHGREWTSCPAENVLKDDVVVDVGRIACKPEIFTRYEAVAGVPDVAVGVKVKLTGIAGNQVVLDHGTRVRAFRLVELWAVGGSWTSAAGRGSPPTATPTTSMSPASTTTPRSAGTTRTISALATRWR